VYTLGSPAKIACVDVEVYDGGAVNAPLVLERAHRHRHVIEDAEALAMAGKGVVRAAGEVHRDPAVEGRARRGDRPADGAMRPLDERRAPREPDPPHGRRVERPGVERVHVLRRVRAEQFVARGAGRIAELLRRHEAEREHTLTEQRVLLDRETVPGGQRDAVRSGTPRQERHRARRGISPVGDPAWR